MASMTRATILSASALSLSTLLVGACAPEVSDGGVDSDDSVAAASDELRTDGTSHIHMMPLMTPSSGDSESLITTSAPAGALLQYFGGPVIQNVKVFAIYWNSSVPSQSTLNSFYSTVTASAYMDWLTEYNTTSPAQAIGRGTLGGSVVDTGAPTGTSITDAQIQTEIKRLITAGQLPANNANNLYMIHFPTGVSISAPDGSKSCVQFCAYHGTFVLNGVNAMYGVMPDLSGGCATGCGSNTKINNTTSVASHELIEAITDPAVGLATVFGPPLGWYDKVNGEIGDICNGQQGTIAGFTVQKQFSNKFKDCIVVPPTAGACAHAICTTGTKLTSGCDPCVTQICAADSFCCTTTWDSVCVGEVTSVCGKSCP
jgi:hypothetical protein